MSMKLIVSYDISTGIVHFADGSKRRLNDCSTIMVDKLIYLVTSSDNNFSTPDLSNEKEVDIAFDLLSTE
jgi:hypothetical protein